MKTSAETTASLRYAARQLMEHHGLCVAHYSDGVRQSELSDAYEFRLSLPRQHGRFELDRNLIEDLQPEALITEIDNRMADLAATMRGAFIRDVFDRDLKYNVLDESSDDAKLQSAERMALAMIRHGEKLMQRVARMRK